MFIRLVLLVSTLALTEADYDISSERVTNWGNWGWWDECPKGSYVKAINVKVEPKLGSGDDTAMNAVHLSCVNLETQVTNSYFRATKILRSSEGQWGDFTGLEYCHKGVAVGFQLRSESKQGSGDDTATNDMRLICANQFGTSKTTERGQDWGYWRSIKLCPKKTAVCGLRTQVEPHQKDDDDTSLNNVDLRCCELPDPAKSCRPSDEWVTVFQRDNSKGRTPIKHTHREKLGVQKSTSTSASASVIDEISAQVGFEAGITATALKALGLTFEAKLSRSTKTEHTWSRTETSAFQQETEQTTELEIPAQCDTTYEQLVGKCGPYVVRSNVMRRIDKCADGTKKTVTKRSAHFVL